MGVCNDRWGWHGAKVSGHAAPPCAPQDPLQLYVCVRSDCLEYLQSLEIKMAELEQKCRMFGCQLADVPEWLYYTFVMNVKLQEENATQRRDRTLQNERILLLQDCLNKLQSQLRKAERQRLEMEGLHRSIVEKASESEKEVQKLQQENAVYEERLAGMQKQLEALQEQEKEREEALSSTPRAHNQRVLDLQQLEEAQECIMRLLEEQWQAAESKIPSTWQKVPFAQSTAPSTQNNRQEGSDGEPRKPKLPDVSMSSSSTAAWSDHNLERIEESMPCALSGCVPEAISPPRAPKADLATTQVNSPPVAKCKLESPSSWEHKQEEEAEKEHAEEEGHSRSLAEKVTECEKELQRLQQEKADSDERLVGLQKELEEALSSLHTYQEEARNSLGMSSQSLPALEQQLEEAEDCIGLPLEGLKTIRFFEMPSTRHRGRLLQPRRYEAKKKHFAPRRSSSPKLRPWMLSHSLCPSAEPAASVAEAKVDEDDTADAEEVCDRNVLMEVLQDLERRQKALATLDTAEESGDIDQLVEAISPDAPSVASSCSTVKTGDANATRTLVQALRGRSYQSESSDED